MYERMLNKNEKPTAEQLSFPMETTTDGGISHKRKGKFICNVFPESGAFTIMIRLSDKQFSSVYEKLDEYAKEYIDNKYPCNDGGWIHYRVTDEEQLANIRTLIATKCGK